MSRPYTQRSGPYQDPTLYDDDANGNARAGAPGYGAPPASYEYNNQSARNEYGRTAQDHERTATDAAYPTDRYPGAPGYDRGSQERFAGSGGPRSDGRNDGGRERYTDRDREGYTSDHDDVGLRAGDKRSSPYRGAGSNPPSRTLILEGLPFEMTQEDITNELRTNFHANNLDEVRLIKDKRTGLSRQFAFAQFTSIADAKTFYDKNSPSIRFLGKYGDGTGAEEDPHVTIAYSREKDERPLPGQSENDWLCEVCTLVNYGTRTICFKCHAPRSNFNAMTRHGMPVGISNHTGFLTTGDHDVSTSASQFLLFRALEAGVTEELLAKAVTKLYRNAPNPHAPDGMPNKKAKIASTSADTSSGAKIGSLRRVLLVRDRKDDHSWKYGFAEFATVEDAIAAMAKYTSSDKFTISSKPVMASYIHAGVFIPVLQSAVPVADKFTFSPLNNPAMKLMYWDQGAYCSELVVEKEKTNLEKMQEKVAAATKRAKAAAADEGLLGPLKEKDIATSKKRKAEKDTGSLSTSKPVAPHLAFWSNRHAEIHGLPPVAPVAEGVFGGESAKSTTAASNEPAQINAPESPTFVDMEKLCCLLCRAQFKNADAVNKHLRRSKLHADNAKNKELVNKTLLDNPQLKTEGAEDESAYRDRAKERRQQFAQPKQPQGKKAAPPSVEDDVPIKPADNKAAKMLEKMGWTAGQGLGAEGTGRTEAISTELYAQGVGLGAAGGKVGDAVEEANKATGSTYADFLQKGKDKTRERFEGMQ